MPDRIAIIQLARFGDIVSILPIAKHLVEEGKEVTIFCHSDFAGILDAAKYVKCFPLETTHRDIYGAVAKAKLDSFEEIFITQVAANDRKPPFETDNYQCQQWARAGYLGKFHNFKLEFDNRNKEFEEKSIRLHVPPEDGRPLLAYSFHGVSSIFLRRQEQERWVKRTFLKTHRLLNLGDLCVPMVHNLIGLIEKADKLLTIDTLPLHLAYATMTPTIALTHDDPSKRSEPRKHWIEHIQYSDSLTDEGRERIVMAVNDKSPKLGRFIRNIEVPQPERENDNRVAIISLARYGDIVNAIPIAYDLHKNVIEVHWFVHQNFSSILEAVSYIKPHLWSGSEADVTGAANYARRLGFSRVMELQVNGNKTPSPIECENFITQQWARGGYLHKFHDIPLVFDNRDIEGEDEAISQIPYGNGKPLISYCLESHSSPMGNKDKFEEWLIKEFGEKYQLLNIGKLKLEKVHHLLGIIAISERLITIDTLPMHLAYAVNTPTIGLSADRENYKERYKWYQSEPRKHWIEKLNYSDALTESGKNRIREAINSSPEFGKFCRNFEKFKLARIVHVVEWHVPPQQDERRRLLSANKTWEATRNSDTAYKLAIIETDKAKRTSKTELGDSRSLPFVHDIIESGIAIAEPDDIVMLTNSDICLTPECAATVRSKLQKEPCCFSRRIDVPNADTPKSVSQIAGIPAHCGTDLFAFRPSWWEKRKPDFPDLLAACEGWDFVFRHIMLWDNPNAQMNPAVIYHEVHRAYWYRGDVIKANIGQVHNRKLCREWAIKYGYNEALQPDSSNGLFKLDGHFSRITPHA